MYSSVSVSSEYSLESASTNSVCIRPKNFVYSRHTSRQYSNQRYVKSFRMCLVLAILGTWSLQTSWAYAVKCWLWFVIVGATNVWLRAELQCSESISLHCWWQYWPEHCWHHFLTDSCLMLIGFLNIRCSFCIVLQWQQGIRSNLHREDRFWLVLIARAANREQILRLHCIRVLRIKQILTRSTTAELNSIERIFVQIYYQHQTHKIHCWVS